MCLFIYMLVLHVENLQGLVSYENYKQGDSMLKDQVPC